MAYSKTHDDFLAVCADLPTQLIDLMSVLVPHIDQNECVHTIKLRGEKTRKTVVSTIMALTGSDKTRTSKLLKILRESGLVVEISKFHIKFTDSLIKKSRGEFGDPTYKVPQHIMNMKMKAAMYLEKPRLHKGEEEMSQAMKKEFNILKEDNKYLRDQNDRLEMTMGHILEEIRKLNPAYETPFRLYSVPSVTNNG